MVWEIAPIPNLLDGSSPKFEYAWVYRNKQDAKLEGMRISRQFKFHKSKRNLTSYKMYILQGLWTVTEVSKKSILAKDVLERIRKGLYLYLLVRCMYQLQSPCWLTGTRQKERKKKRQQIPKKIWKTNILISYE